MEYFRVLFFYLSCYLGELTVRAHRLGPPGSIDRDPDSASGACDREGLTLSERAHDRSF